MTRTIGKSMMQLFMIVLVSSMTVIQVFGGTNPTTIAPCAFSSCGSMRDAVFSRKRQSWSDFARPIALHAPSSHSALYMAAKSKKGKNKGSKGFGKQEETENKISNKKETATTNKDNSESATYFESIEQTGGDALFSAKSDVDIDPNLPPEERTKQILKKQYGLRTFEDQQMDLKKSEQQAKFAALKKKADSGQDIDVFQLVPAPLLIFIDRFLKVGLAISTLIFVSAGVGITLEAWSVASGSPLPSNVDSFIVQTIEPNFTYMLLILLTFSISLGLFATAQLGSDASQYSEK